MGSRSPMDGLKWIAVPIAAAGLIFGFFALAWTEVVQGVIAAGLLTISALIWNGFGRGR